MMGKLVIRFEVPNIVDSGRPWKLATSFRISTEVDDALALAARYVAGEARLSPTSPLLAGPDTLD